MIPFLPAPDLVAVVPVIIGPLQALLAILPAVLAALGGALMALFRPSTVNRLFRLLWAQKVSVLALVLIVWGAVYTVERLWPDGRAASNAKRSGDSAWTQFRGGAARTGHVADGQADPARGGVHWVFQPGSDINFYSSPTVVGNRVYVASAKVTLFNRQGQGQVFALDAETGAVVWRGGPPGYRATFSSPAVAGNRLAIGEGLHEARDSRISVLDLDRDGELLWTFRTDSHTESSPVIHRGRVYFGAGRDGYYGFELEPDGEGEGRMLWHVPGDRYPDASGSPGAWRDWILVPMGRWGGQAIAALNAETGEEAWRIDVPYPVFSGPTVSEERGLVFIGMGTGNFIQTAEEALPGELKRLSEQGLSGEELAAAAERLGPAGEVWAIDLETRELRWRFETERTVIAQVALDDPYLYVASRDGLVNKLDVVSGRSLASWNARDAILASPAVGSEHVYIMTSGGRLVALKKDSLTPVWDEALGAAPSLSSPVVANGRVVVGTSGRGLLSVGSTERVPQTPLWAADRGGPTRSGWERGALPGTRGRYAWSYRPESNVELDGAAANLSAPPGVAPATEAGQALYLAWSDGDRHGVEWLEFRDGAGRPPVRVWWMPTARAVSRTPVLVGGVLFVLDGETGEEGRMLRAVDAPKGTPRWARPVAPDASGELLASRDIVLAVDRARGWSAYDPASDDGEPLWTAELGLPAGLPVISGDLLVTATVDPPALTVLDLPTGRELWRRKLESVPKTGPVLVEETVWLGDTGGVHGYNLVTGEPSRGWDGAAPVDRLVNEGGRLGWTDTSGTVRVVSPASAEVLAIVAGVEPVYAPLLGERAMLVWKEGGLYQVDLDSGESVFWTRLTASWPGVPFTPPLMVDGHLLFGTEARGLVSIGLGTDTP